MTTLPEAGGVAWTTVYTQDGVKINLTSRAETPGMALKNLLAAIEETGVYTDLNQPYAPPHQPDPFPDEPQAVPVIGQNLGLLDRKPKASDLGFGDRYEVKVDQYKATADEIKFYISSIDFPYFTHKMNNDYAAGKFAEIFKGWQPLEDDQKHPIPNGAVILEIQCTDESRHTSQGNPYQNLDGMRRP